MITFQHSTFSEDSRIQAFCQSENLTPHFHTLHRIFIAQKKHKIIGLGVFNALSETVAELTLLYVLPRFRGQKIGRKLAILAIEHAQSERFQRLLLAPHHHTEQTFKLLSELGFAEKPLIYKNTQQILQWCVDLTQWSQDETKQENLFQLFDFNRAWATQMKSADALYFQKLARLQKPKYLWIGCSDSRVPANQVVGLLPGELFVHRNMANVVAHSDLNALSVIQYAVDVLKVQHIMVVGHSGCGGVAAVLHQKRIGLADVWLRHVQDVFDQHAARLQHVPSNKRHDLLCRLNVLEQVMNVARTTVLQDAWHKKQNVTLHGWIYNIRNGLMHDLGLTIHGNQELSQRYQIALNALMHSF